MLKGIRRFYSATHGNSMRTLLKPKEGPLLFTFGENNDYDAYQCSATHKDTIIHNMTEGLLNDNIFSKADQQNARMNYDEAKRYTADVVNLAIEQERAVIFYERSNPSEFVGYFSYCPSGFDNNAYICDGWKP